MVDHDQLDRLFLDGGGKLGHLAGSDVEPRIRRPAADDMAGNDLGTGRLRQRDPLGERLFSADAGGVQMDDNCPFAARRAFEQLGSGRGDRRALRNCRTPDHRHGIGRHRQQV